MSVPIIGPTLPRCSQAPPPAVSAPCEGCGSTGLSGAVRSVWSADALPDPSPGATRARQAAVRTAVTRGRRCTAFLLEARLGSVSSPFDAVPRSPARPYGRCVDDAAALLPVTPWALAAVATVLVVA